MNNQRHYQHEVDVEMTSPTALFGVDSSLAVSSPELPAYHQEQQHDWNLDDHFNPLTALPTGHANDHHEFNMSSDWGLGTTAEDDAACYASDTQQQHQSRLQQIQQATPMKRSTSQPLANTTTTTPSRPLPQPVFTRDGRTLGTPMTSSTPTPGSRHSQNSKNRTGSTNTPKKKGRIGSRARNAASSNNFVTTTGLPASAGIAKKPRRAPPTSIPLEWNPPRPVQIQPAPAPAPSYAATDPFAASSGQVGLGLGMGTSTFEFGANATNDMISPRTVGPARSGDQIFTHSYHNDAANHLFAEQLQRHYPQQPTMPLGAWTEATLDPALLRMSNRRDVSMNGPITAREARAAPLQAAGQEVRRHAISAVLASSLHAAITGISGECERLREIVNSSSVADEENTDSNAISDTERARLLARHHNASLTFPYAPLAPLPHTHAESPLWSLDALPATPADIGVLDHDQLDGLLAAHLVSVPGHAFVFEKRRALMVALGLRREIVRMVLE